MAGGSVNRFYKSTLRRLVRARRLDPAAKTLVVCGGDLDRDMLVYFGFTDVIISNFDTQMAGFPPYEWAHQDAENLTYRDGAFEQVIEHNGLHHCASPHRALLEMYRVASRIVVAFEPRDSISLRLARRIGLTSDYEVATVVDHDCRQGGARNTAVPNYVYRWTERDIEKAVASFDPARPPRCSYFHGLALPPLGKLGAIVAPLAKIIAVLAPKQGNRFGFVVEKREAAHAWMSADLSRIDEGWRREHVAA